MKKYSSEWKSAQQEKNGGWAQKDDNVWKWHYIQYSTEYAKSMWFNTEKACKNANISPDYNLYADQF